MMPTTIRVSLFRTFFRSRDLPVRRAADSVRVGALAAASFVAGLIVTNAHALRSLLINDADGVLALACLLLLTAALFAILAFAAMSSDRQPKYLGPRRQMPAWARVKVNNRGESA